MEVNTPIYSVVFYFLTLDYWKNGTFFEQNLWKSCGKVAKKKPVEFTTR